MLNIKNFIAVLICVAALSACAASSTASSQGNALPIALQTASLKEIKPYPVERKVVGPLTDEQKAGFKDLVGFPFAAAVPDLLEYCKSQLPPRIVERRSVNGYHDARGRFSLGTAVSRFVSKSNDFDFVEYRITGTKGRKRLYPGTIIRLSFEPEGSTGCDQFLMYAPTDFRLPGRIPEGQCLALKPVPGKNSQVLVRNLDAQQYRIGGLAISISGSEYIESKTGFRLGGQTSININHSDKEGYQTSLSCSVPRLDEKDILGGN